MASATGAPGNSSLIGLLLISLCALLHAPPTFGRELIGVEEAMSWEVPPVDARIFYGADPNQFGELRLPAGRGPHPVAVLVHGGGWEAQYGIRYFGRFAEGLTRAGIATWSLEYRRVDNEGGGWPGTFEDVARGTDHLRSIAARHRLDLGRVIAIGHSAGGQLALWLGARPRIELNRELQIGDPLPLRGLMGIAAVNDLEYWYTHPVLRVCDKLKECEPTVGRLMGGSPERYPQRYVEASPRRMLPLGLPTTIVVGAKDIWSQDRYYEAAKAAGEEATLLEFADAGHFELIDPESAPWPLVVAAARELLDRQSNH
jgi:acetyl esterase/lipase